MRTMFDALPADLRSQLKAMTPDQIRSIADYVHVERCNAEQTQHPIDPAEGLPALHAVLCREFQREVDDPIEHVLTALTLLRLACISGINGHDNLDAIDLQAMVYLVDDAFVVMRDHAAHQREIRTRLRQMTHPLKK